MYFSSCLQPAILIKRYKRFLADVKLADNRIITIHCANTGAMTGCANSGDTIWYSTSDNPKRKLPYTWELTQTNDQYWICVNTIKANAIVKEAILKQQIPCLVEYDQLLSEVKYGQEGSRIDLLLKSTPDDECYIEVKSVTLCNTEKKIGYFPDAVTARGQKHLRELMLIKQQGKRAILFFVILHTGIKSFSPASWIDPKYSQLLKQAIEMGVEVLCYDTVINTEQIIINQAIPLILNDDLAD